MQEGTIAQDVRGSDRNQLGLILPKHKADAIRLVTSSPVMHDLSLSHCAC